MTGFERIARPLYYYREEHRVPEEYLKAYLLGLSSVRRAVGLHGPGMVGWAKTAEFLLTAHAKGIIYRAATALGRQRKLVAARSLAIGKEEQQAAEAEIRKIRQTNVPGLPERELEATYRE
jgi:hypothetical protein